MEFTIENECLYKAILDVSKAVSVSTSFPILSGIKIIATDHSLVLVGSDSDLFIEKMIPRVIDGKQVLQIFEQGSDVISAKYFSNLVKKLPGKIHIKVNKQTATIRSGDIVTRLNGLNGEEYPKTPLVDEEKCAVIPSSKLIEVIKQTAFAVSSSENRPVLTAVNMTFNENLFSCAATDSHRLALTELTIRSAIDGSCNVPRKSLTELAKLIQHDTGDTQIYYY
ncbi:DNA polymerase III subunit beta [Bacillus sp. FSL H8-0547]